MAWKIFVPTYYVDGSKHIEFSDEAMTVYAIIRMHSMLYLKRTFYMTIKNIYANLYCDTAFPQPILKKIKTGVQELCSICPEWGHSINETENEWVFDGPTLNTFQKNIHYTYIYESDFESFIKHTKREYFKDFGLYIRILDTFTHQYNGMFGEDECNDGILGKLSCKALGTILSKSEITIWKKRNSFVERHMFAKFSRPAYMTSDGIKNQSDFLCRYSDSPRVKQSIERIK